MKPFFAIAFCLLQLTGSAQTIQVIVPDVPVVKGTAFQVQYILTQPQNFVAASTPQFDSCRIVSGPAFYKGNAVVQGRLQPIQNITYTLVPQRVGALTIGSLQAHFKEGDIKSDGSKITVVEPPKASYKASSNATNAALFASAFNNEKLVAENLFLKTIVSKKTGYIGEAIAATFKLYSRLQSTSEALNAPSFYGFAVADMLPVNEAHINVEVVNGKVYNTAILRQVQVFPQQAGRLLIDPLQIETEIELEDSTGQRKRQWKKDLASEAVPIDVLPYPVTVPDNYSGAVGDFQLAARLNKLELNVDEEGQLVISINGSGNFIQFGGPQIVWPQGIELLSESSNERLNKQVLPMSGIREYVYQFSAAKGGQVVIPSVSFSYFDVRKKQFVKLASSPLVLKVKAGSMKKQRAAIRLPKSKTALWALIAFASASLSAFAFLFFIRKKKKEQAAAVSVPIPGYVQQLSALDSSKAAERDTVIRLQQILSSFLQEKKQQLTRAQEEEIRSLLAVCREKAYAPLTEEKNMALLIERSKEICGQVSEQHLLNKKL